MVHNIRWKRLHEDRRMVLVLRCVRRDNGPYKKCISACRPIWFMVGCVSRVNLVHSMLLQGCSYIGRIALIVEYVFNRCRVFIF